MQPDRLMRAGVFLVILAGAPRIVVAAGPAQVAPSSPESTAFREFSQHVQQYVKLHEPVRHLRTTKQSKEIVERRNALAQKIREMRPNAKPGDIFTPEVSEAFRRVIRSTFQGPNARNVRQTIRQGDPVAGLHLSVNDDYPDRLPRTSVPPTLLLRLPRLPSEVAYRIIGHDFVLQDTQARLIVDFIPGVVP